MRRLIVLLLAFFPLPSLAERTPPAAILDAFVRDRLTESVMLMDQHFRVSETGQYYDFIQIGQPQPANAPSSIAATGLGLISLAIGDALNLIPDAEAKAATTLRHLTGRGAHPGFELIRSPSGWYPHFIDPLTGVPVNGSEEKFSTIDTALLAAGAATAMRYFAAKSYAEGRGASEVHALARELIDTVDWNHAIKSVDRGLLHLVFYGPEERPSENVFANPFDEYVMLPCLAMRAERLMGYVGPAHELFQRHYSDAAAFPMVARGEQTLVAKPSGYIPAHFTHQFAFFHCPEIGDQPAFRAELFELAAADRAFFDARRAEASGTFPAALWGHGAGTEIRFRPDGSLDGQGYGVARVDENPHDAASPAIMAGFAPLWRSGEPGDPMTDLYELWQAETCRYDHAGLGFLWRCSAREPQHAVARVEAVDFSTYVLGLAARDRDLGIGFLRLFGP
ncbi:MAG: hypothetical protein AAGE03_02985 [Pseudomonadota bacterium]